MLQLNRAKFSLNGNCGYVLKPQCMCQGEAPGAQGHGASAGPPGGSARDTAPRMPGGGVRGRTPTLPGIREGCAREPLPTLGPP